MSMTHRCVKKCDWGGSAGLVPLKFAINFLPRTVGQDPLPCEASLPADKNSCPKSPFLERLRRQANRLTQDAPAAAVGTASPYPSWRTVRTPSSASRASEKRSLLSLGMEIVGARRRRLGIGGNRHGTQNNCHSGQRHCEFSHALPPTRKPHAAETILDALPLYLQVHRASAVPM